MKVYYNEIDKKKCAALKALMEDGHISKGDIDDRPIQEVQANDLTGYTRCHFFAGIGVWDFALNLAGWPTNRNVWTASCPCQGYSLAGKRRLQSDERHLWPHFDRLVEESKPSEIFGEQVDKAIAAGWLDDIFYDLETKNYACTATVLRSCGVQGCSERGRLYFAAYSDQARLPAWNEQGEFGPQAIAHPRGELERILATGAWREWENQSGISLLDDGLAKRVGLISAAGDAIDPWLAAEFVQAYRECLT